MNTIENNKLIAEFMGFKFHDIDGSCYCVNGDKYIKPKSLIRLDKGEKLEYDTSWDWLMPVVEKIESLPEVDEFMIKYDSVYKTIEVQILPSFKDSFERICNFMPLEEPKIATVYNTCIEFIKWYNQQSK